MPVDDKRRTFPEVFPRGPLRAVGAFVGLVIWANDLNVSVDLRPLGIPRHVGHKASVDEDGFLIFQINGAFEFCAQKEPVLRGELGEGFPVHGLEVLGIFALVVAQEAAFVVAHEGANARQCADLGENAVGIGTSVDHIAQEVNHVIALGCEFAQEDFEFVGAAVYVSDSDVAGHSRRGAWFSIALRNALYKCCGMEWQFKPPAKCSTLSGSGFTPGDRIECWLYLDEQAQIQRADLRSDEAAQFQPPGRVLGRWSRVVKASEDERREAQRQVLASAEEIFLSLFAEGTSPSEEGDTLKQLLALMLERKRVLRAEGTPDEQGRQRYWHIKGKATYTINVSALTPEKLQKIEAQLESIVA